MSNSRIILEEFWSLTAEIETILNSHSLIPLSTDPNEIKILIPNHVLFDRRIISISELDVTKIYDNRFVSLAKLIKNGLTFLEKNGA